MQFPRLAGVVSAVLLSGFPLLGRAQFTAVLPDTASPPSVTAAAEAGKVGFLVPPSIAYGDLFRDVQLQRIFPDSKTFVDYTPRQSPARINFDYYLRRDQPGFDLRAFVEEKFTPPPEGADDLRGAPGEPVRQYISRLWDALVRQTKEVPAYSSQLPLPYPFVVPGDRFRELYYWDAYFTMLGLEVDNRHDLSLNLVDNFAAEIERYGHVLNGSRNYYLSRSQPPFFSSMIELIAQRDGDNTFVTFLPQLEREYAFWMDGAEFLAPGQAYRRVVRLADGTILNRNYDDRKVPRDESYAEDVATAQQATGRPAANVYRSLRAGAESGWDFSSRWFAEGVNLASIRTLSIAPVDLNCLLCHLEQTIARAHRVLGDETGARVYDRLACRRARTIRQRFWSPEAAVFTDYLWQEDRLTGTVTAATFYPLFFGVASEEQATAVAGTTRQQLLQPGGVATTLVQSGQQWDAPNGWAPLQWLAVAGLNRYGQPELARTVAERWIRNVLAGYENSRTLVEKYDTTNPGTGGGGGEYATQSGFGWTNGVLLKLLALYPDTIPPTSASARPAPPSWRWGTGWVEEPHSVSGASSFLLPTSLKLAD